MSNPSWAATRHRNHWLSLRRFRCRWLERCCGGTCATSTGRAGRGRWVDPSLDEMPKDLLRAIWRRFLAWDNPELRGDEFTINEDVAKILAGEKNGAEAWTHCIAAAR